ncbi:MAG: hypothetical protein EDM79_16965 [Chloroflexi bacterium]|nr:MAG: hypothetical protein EDM79_16965 [Chloroflexota bacterium]
MEGVTKGTVVIATVYGDVHDIGKNLVKTILANNGYTVIDLGKQVPAETIITKAVEVNATAIGLSALLVSTSKQMPLIVNELHRRGHKVPVLIGGAAINRRFGRRILQTESGDFYEPGVFYCKDAFEGLETMDVLINSRKLRWNSGALTPNLPTCQLYNVPTFSHPLSPCLPPNSACAWSRTCRWRSSSRILISTNCIASRGAPRTPTVRSGTS